MRSDAVRRLLVVSACLGLLAIFASSRFSSRTSPAMKRREIFDTALMAGDVSTVRAILDQGESVNGDPSEYEYISPLHAAAREGKDGVVSLLLDRGADIRTGDGWGAPLEGAARAGHISTVKLLIRRGILNQDRQSQLDDALWGAAVEGQTQMVKLLLAYGANPSQDRGKPTGTLRAACKQFGQTEVVSLLKKAGAKDPAGLAPVTAHARRALH